MTNRHGKTALFMDGANFYATGKAVGVEIDYKRLLAEFQRLETVVRAFYYTAVARKVSSVRSSHFSIG